MTFEDQVEAGGVVFLPMGVTTWSRAINIKAPVTIQGTPGSLSVLQLPAHPAQNFMAADGTPIGPPKTPHKGSNNLLYVTGDVPGIVLSGFTLDYNIQDPSDVFGGCPFFKNALSPQLLDLELVNNYGGVENYPDPPHVNAPGMVVRNYRAGLRTAIPTEPTVHGGSPGILIFGAPGGCPGALVTGVDGVGFLEFDVVAMKGLQLLDVAGTHMLVGSLSDGDWDGAVFDTLDFDWPSSAGPVLEFNDEQPSTNLTVRNSSFAGRIGNAHQFKGTWGPNNSPDSL